MQQMGTPEPRARVLVVDDEPNIREMVAINLEREGLDVVFADDGLTAVEIAREMQPDLVVLDIMLPEMDGFQVCRTIRAESTVPILLLSARGEEIDRIVGLELGADDFLAKPFAMRELVARVRAMLRRARMVGQGAFPSEPGQGGEGNGGGLKTQVEAQRQVVQAGDIEVDVLGRAASIRGAILTLKPKEFDLLLYFVRHPGIVLSRDALLREVWGYEYPVDTRTVDVHVRWLRQKIEREPGDPSRIQTMRGHGYRFVTDDS